jgi:Protein of unknown function (DUF1326)
MFSKRNVLFALLVLIVASCGIVTFASATSSSSTSAAQTPLTGSYVEVRSCDIYTGPCFANGEMNLTGREAMMTWSIQHGSFDGVKLDGLSVIAVVKAENTLGDVNRFPEPSNSVLIVDELADAQQREALIHFARSKAGSVLGETTNIQSAPIVVDACPNCTKGGCSKVHAGDLVNIETRCLTCKDCVCGNEELFYPPLTKIENSRPAYTTAAMFHGQGLGEQFDEANRRSAYLGTFGQ